MPTSPSMENDRGEAGLWGPEALAVDATVLPPVPAPAVAREADPSLLGLGLLAGAVTALLGGLAWAGIVIVTRYDFGLLAWFVGAGAGLAIVRVAGGGVAMPWRVLAGVFAAAAILVGRYVIFVHDVKSVLGSQLAAEGVSVGYFDTSSMNVFVHNFDSIVRPTYYIWVAFAFFAAVRTAGGGPVLRRARRLEPARPTQPEK